MKNVRLIDHLQSAIAVIDKDMNIVEANLAYSQRSKQEVSNVIGTKCFHAAYQFDSPCSKQTSKPCPVEETFQTKKPSSQLHHFWITDHAIVEEITTTPILEENGEVNYVIEEFRDITKLLALKNGIISICSYCKKIHDDDGQWVLFENYIQKHTGANFSHGICGECSEKVLGQQLIQSS